MKEHLLFLTLLAPRLLASEFDGARDLVARRVPRLQGHVRFERLEGASVERSWVDDDCGAVGASAR